MENSMEVSKKNKNCPLIRQFYLCVIIQSKNTNLKKYVHPMYVVAIANIKKQPKCLLIDECIKKI